MILFYRKYNCFLPHLQKKRVSQYLYYACTLRTCAWHSTSKHKCTKYVVCQRTLKEEAPPQPSPLVLRKVQAKGREFVLFSFWLVIVHIIFFNMLIFNYLSDIFYYYHNKAPSPPPWGNVTKLIIILFIFLIISTFSFSRIVSFFPHSVRY